MSTLIIYSPAGAVAQARPLRLAAKRLQALGFEVQLDSDVLARQQRFGGDDATRLEALHRVARAQPHVALASRGGYGLTRLLDQIDWKLLAHAAEHGTRWVGLSDLTALQLGLLAHTGAMSWSGPLAVADFGVSQADGGVDEVTRDCFLEAMDGSLEAVGFRETVSRRGEARFDGLEARGTLWGGNLTMLCSLLGTRHFPRIKGGILFLEDVAEHPYRIERQLLQLQQAGVLDAQKAVLLGEFSAWKKSPLDKGYGLADAFAAVQSRTSTPLLSGLPYGHVRTKVTLPIGPKVDLLVQGRDVMVAWGHDIQPQPKGHNSHSCEVCAAR
ncbi:LD-carboxypeptidase [Roseateles sp. BYS180W]|uniref:LD-carboxypeptidase n=1 Tax=Roseateles rivi TaxID=3299028 RepID=A0ABW7FYU5_9BURK